MRILCTLSNMSEQVSGVRFTPAPEGNGWVSEDLTPALANAFATIPGYSLMPEPEPEPEPTPPAKKGK